MEYALIKNSEVKNIIVADADFILSITAEYDHIEPIDTAAELALRVGIGWGWVNNAFVAPAIVPPPVLPVVPNPTEWLIDVGPFFDRFGSAKMAVLMSTNTTIMALRADLQVRKWVDLKRADVGQGIDAMIAVGITGVTTTLKNTILNTVVAPEENLALRKQFFS